MSSDVCKGYGDGLRESQQCVCSVYKLHVALVEE